MNDYLKDLLSEIKNHVGFIVKEYQHELDKDDPYVYESQDAIFEKLESIEAVFEYEEIKGDLIEKVAFNLYSPEGEAEYHNVLQMIKNNEFDRADLEDMQADLNGFLEEHPDVLVSVDDLRDELISKVEEKIDELTNIAQESKDINVISAAVEDIKDLKTITEGFPYTTIERKTEYKTLEDIVDDGYLGKEDLQSLLDKLEEGEIVGIEKVFDSEYGFDGYQTFYKEPSYKEDVNDVTNDGDDTATNDDTDDVEDDNYDRID